MGGWEELRRRARRLSLVRMRVVCTDQFGITQPDAVRRALHSGVQIRNFTGDVTYHPKVYLAHNGKGRPTRFLVSSANLSYAAFTDSVEAGVLGEDPFGSFLDETVRGEKVNNRPLTVQRYRRVDEIKTCHVLFISGSEANRLEQIFNGLKGRNILTVGDCDGFARRGGMIRFVNEKSKIRLKIGLETTKAANLTVSSKLLRPADIVAPGKD